MSKLMNQQILLKSYPTGEPKESNFALVETAIPEPGEVEQWTVDSGQLTVAESGHQTVYAMG